MDPPERRPGDPGSGLQVGSGEVTLRRDLLTPEDRLVEISQGSPVTSHEVGVDVAWVLDHWDSLFAVLHLSARLSLIPHMELVL